MNKILIIPNCDNIAQSLELSQRYGLGFEYNDFFSPAVLDDKYRCGSIIDEYLKHPLPRYCTLHGAFFDVTVTSVDDKIREISRLRVTQSIEAACRIGAKAVVFHTNYNPFLNTPAYISSFIRQNVEYWGEILKQYKDIDIYLENMFDTSPYVMEGIAEGLKDYSSFGICLDYAHAGLTSVPHAEWFAVLGKYIKHIHINDNDGKSDLHLAVGDGKTNWEDFYALYEHCTPGASVLVETTDIERQKRSIEKLVSDGFIIVEGN